MLCRAESKTVIRLREYYIGACRLRAFDPKHLDLVNQFYIVIEDRGNI